MSVFDTIRTLRAVRAFAPDLVPDDAVRRIVEAGRLTGSGMNKQPWHFVVVRNRATLAHLGEIATTGPYIAGAPLAIVIGIDRTKLAVSDASRAIHSMMLAAWDEGIASNWVGFHGLDAVRPLLGIPDEIDVLAILPFGYPAEPPSGRKKQRKPLAEIAHAETWGTPFG